nr:hypothetical protein [uncultured Treponema sp.]
MKKLAIDKLLEELKMGIGWDVFKANVGWNLADSAMGAISDAIDKNAKEQEARAIAAKEQQDKNDMLKTLVFMVGNNIELDRTGKKAIAQTLSDIYGENISLFSIEDKIDASYSEMKNESPKQFFANIKAIKSDREQVCLMYLVVMVLYMGLSDEKLVLPAHVYNLSLIKQFFAVSRNELAQCYSAVSEKINKDVDDIADVFEELTSEESIKKIEAENPYLVYDDTKLLSENESLNPKEEVEKLYYSCIQDLNGDEEFKKRFFLADENPKKVLAAVNAYAKNCKGEEILALYDDSAFGNGKVGFLLTNKKLYVCNTLEKPQEIELSKIEVISATPKKMNSFISVNNIRIDTALCSEVGQSIVSTFLQKVIPLAKQIEVVSE